MNKKYYLLAALIISCMSTSFAAPIPKSQDEIIDAFKDLDKRSCKLNPETCQRPIIPIRPIPNPIPGPGGIETPAITVTWIYCALHVNPPKPPCGKKHNYRTSASSNITH